MVGLLRVIAALAPDNDWSWLRRAARRAMAAAQPVRDKRARIVPSDRIVTAGLALVDAAERGIGIDLATRARMHRDGLLLALLAMRPLRARNFVALRLEHELQRVGGRWIIAFAGSETKNGSPLEVPVPDALVAPLERHIERWRPVLLGGVVSDRLWISNKHRPINVRGMQEIVPRITAQCLGVRLTSHDFRDCLATDVAINNPAEIRIASTLLGHRQTRTTERFYNRARQREAGTLWQETILRSRRRAMRLRT